MSIPQVPPKVSSGPQFIESKNVFEIGATIDESEVKTAAAGKAILYPNVQSCLTITAVLEDGRCIGTHLVGAEKLGQRNSRECIAQMKSEIGTNKVKKLYVMGSSTEKWSKIESFFDKDKVEETLKYPLNEVIALGLFFNSPELYYASIDGVDIYVKDGEKPTFVNRKTQGNISNSIVMSIFNQEFSLEEAKAFLTFK